MNVDAYFEHLVARRANINLGTSVYQVGSLDWADGQLAYDNRFEKPTDGLDFNHIALSDIHLGIDSISYTPRGTSLFIRKTLFKEKSGLEILELTGGVNLDSTYNHLVAAYVLGYKVTRNDMQECNHIRPAQGESDTGVTICYNTVKDVRYIKPIIAGSDICINPVNWHTDATPALLHDTITITVDTTHHVLVATGYSAYEYKPYKNLLNVGDIHSCEPWLYSQCLQQNFAVRTRAWRKKIIINQ